jgi:Tol biopolymer transport system component
METGSSRSTGGAAHDTLAAWAALAAVPVLVVLLLAMASSAAVAQGGARTPAFAADGRLAVAVAGDLWVFAPDGAGGWADATQVTRGPAWDRDPAWLPDGSGLVFASDRSGSVDLWRVGLAQDGRTTEPVRITTSSEHDVEPSVSVTGAIVFSRGRSGDIDLWILADGAERRITDSAGAEREPAWSPDGESIAFIAVRDGRRELRLWTAGATATLVPDRSPRAPAWSPDGTRIAFDAAAPNAGLWVVRSDGTYPQPVSTTRGSSAWSPDGTTLVIAQTEPGDGGYNGDPDRLGERSAGDAFRAAGQLHRVPAPAALPEATIVDVTSYTSADRRHGTR